MSTLSQYMTPAWAAERLVELYFGRLTEHDLVLEPTCGTGAFLAAIPPHVPAIGVELDPDLAEQARANSGREVLTSDIRSVRLPSPPTAVIGNPPFKATLVHDILGMAHAWLPHGGLVGLVLPAYLFQSAGTVLRYRERWRVRADHIPRDLWPKLTKPLVFATFEKGGRCLVGFSLYEEFGDVRQLAKRVRAALDRPAPQPWRAAVGEVLEALGGEASLSEIYAALEPKRPTGNPWWREKARQILQLHFTRTGSARYALAA